MAKRFLTSAAMAAALLAGASGPIAHAQQSQATSTAAGLQAAIDSEANSSDSDDQKAAAIKAIVANSQASPDDKATALNNAIAAVGGSAGSDTANALGQLAGSAANAIQTSNPGLAQQLQTTVASTNNVFMNTGFTSGSGNTQTSSAGGQGGGGGANPTGGGPPQGGGGGGSNGAGLATGSGGGGGLTGGGGGTSGSSSGSGYRTVGP